MLHLSFTTEVTENFHRGAQSDILVCIHPNNFIRMVFTYILVSIFISLCIFYYFSQKSKIRREELRERRREKREEYLNTLLHRKEKDETTTAAEESDTTKDE